MRFWRLWTIGAAFVWAIAASSGASPAQAAPPALDVRPALGDALIQGRWQPLVVTLLNPDTGDALQGEVQVALEDPRSGVRMATYTAPVVLPRGTGTGRATVTVFVPANAQPDVAVFVVRNRDGSGDVLTRRTFDKVPVLNATLTLVAVSQTPDTLDYLRGEKLGVFAGTSGGMRPAVPAAPVSPAAARNRQPYSRTRQPQGAMPVRLVGLPDPGTLPDRAAGYGSVHIVYLGRDVLPDTFSDAQVSALRSWVTTGGGLLVSASQKLRGDERFRVWLPTQSDAQKVGRGTVALPAFDPAEPAFAHGPNALPYWQKTAKGAATTRSLVGLLTDGRDTQYRYSAGNFYQSVLRAPGLKAPGVLPIGLFMVAYLFLLVPVSYQVLRRLDKREWMWATAPALVVLFSVGAYGFGYATKGTQLFQNVVTVAEMQAGSGDASLCGAVGLFSPRRARYDVEVQAPDALFWLPQVGYDYGGSQNQNAEYGAPVIREGDNKGAMVRSGEVSMWAMRTWGVRSDTLKLGGGIVCDLHDDTKGHIRGTIENRTGKPLESVYVNAFGDGQRIGNMASGEKRSVNIKYNARDVQNRSYRIESLPGLTADSPPDYPRKAANQNRESTPEAQQAALRQSAGSAIAETWGETNTASSASWDKREAIITAWSSDVFLPVSVDGATVKNGANTNLLFVHAPLKGL